MSASPRAELHRPRTLGDLLSDGFSIFFSNFLTFVALAAVVIVPVELIVSGIGLGQLFSDYDSTPAVAAQVMPAVVDALVVTPLVIAMTLYALLAVSEGRRPAFGATVQAGLDAFAPVFLAVLIAASLTVVSAITIVGPIFLAVRWYFVPQVVLLERRRGWEALQGSWELVSGSWWRVFGIVLVTNLVVGIAGVLARAPFLAAADALDSGAVFLVGSIVVGVLSAPIVAIVSSLLYFDLRARREGRPAGAPAA